MSAESTYCKEGGGMFKKVTRIDSMSTNERGKKSVHGM